METPFQRTLRQNQIQKTDKITALIQAVTEGWETYKQLFLKSTSTKNTV